MENSRQPLSMDYVYPKSEDEFKSVHVELYPNPSGDYFDMRINSDEEIAAGDLEYILNGLWTEWFSKLRINPIEDCRITLSAAGKPYEVIIAPAPRIIVTGLRPR